MKEIDTLNHDELVEHIAGELKIFDVSKLYHSVGFGLDKGLNQIILERLRAGETVAVLKVYEPRDLPENQVSGDRARQFIN